jgi:hypothetical protein
MKIFLMQMKVDLIEASFQGEAVAFLRLETVNLKNELRPRRMISKPSLEAEPSNETSRVFV